MLATLMFLTPLFYYLPKFALAAIVMNSVIPLVAFGEARHLFHVKKHDFVLWVTAFLGTLFLATVNALAISLRKVKEMLLAHVTDLEEVNKTQYIVLRS
eukprot:g29790.t1